MAYIEYIWYSIPQKKACSCFHMIASFIPRVEFLVVKSVWCASDFEFMDEVKICDFLNKSYWAVLSYGVVSSFLFFPSFFTTTVAIIKG